MTWLKHKGCTTPAVEYIGKTPLYDGPILRQHEWLNARGKSASLRFDCPDCGELTGIHADQLETCDGSPYRYRDKPVLIVRKQTFFERLRALFTF